METRLSKKRLHWVPIKLDSGLSFVKEAVNILFLEAVQEIVDKALVRTLGKVK